MQGPPKGPGKNGKDVLTEVHVCPAAHVEHCDVHVPLAQVVNAGQSALVVHALLQYPLG